MENKNKPKTIIGNRRPAAKRDGTGQKKEPVSDHTVQYTPQRSARPAQNKAPRRPQSRQRTGEPSQAAIEQARRRRRAAEQRAKQNRQAAANAQTRPPRPAASETPTDARFRRERPRQRVPAQPSAAPAAVIRERRGLRLLLKILAALLAVLLLIFLYARFSPLNSDLSRNLSRFDISSNAAAVASKHRIANVVIFGVDGREDVEGERSDAIMIGSADFEHNRLKVTSLMRDTYVDIAGQDYFDKLNAAYSVGGPEESLRTINKNFDTAITDYVVFDFTALVEMVNDVGGVDINVTDEEELYWINQYLMDVNDKVKTADPDVPGTGMQHLTGSQALAYARIRYTGNGDYDRTQRQRNILEQVAAKASAMNPVAQLMLIQKVMPYIKTTLTLPELLKYSINLVLMKDKKIEQFRLPQDGMVEDGYLDGVSYVFPETLADNIRAWYQFVYAVDYTPSKTAQNISDEILEVWQ